MYNVKIQTIVSELRKLCLYFLPGVVILDGSLRIDACILCEYTAVQSL